MAVFFSHLLFGLLLYSLENAVCVCLLFVIIVVHHKRKLKTREINIIASNLMQIQFTRKEMKNNRRGWHMGQDFFLLLLLLLLFILVSYINKYINIVYLSILNEMKLK